MSSATKGRLCHTRLTLDSSNNGFRIRDVGAATNYTASLTAGDYFIRGDDVTTSGQSDLLKEIEDELNALASAIAFTVSVSHATGKVTIAGSAEFQILHTAAEMTFDTTYLGFDDTANDTGASSYTSDNQAAGLWYPGAEAQLLDHDSEAIRRVTRAISGAQRVLHLGDVDVQSVLWEAVTRDRVKSAYAATNAAFDAVFSNIATGAPFLYYPDNGDDSEVGLWVFDEDRTRIRLGDFAVPMRSGLELYTIRLPMRAYVSETG